MAVMLVECTSVHNLVDKLKVSSYRKSEEIKQKSMSQANRCDACPDCCVVADSVNFDDDIVAGPSKMSLKCPVSFLCYLYSSVSFSDLT